MSKGRTIVHACLGFASAMLLLGIAYATVSATTFQPGGEFNSAREEVYFYLFVWWGLMLALGGAGFVATTVVLVVAGLRPAMPALAGFCAGLLILAAAFTGLSFPQALPLAGALAAGAALSLAALAAPFAAEARRLLTRRTA